MHLTPQTIQIGIQGTKISYSSLALPFPDTRWLQIRTHSFKANPTPDIIVHDQAMFFVQGAKNPEQDQYQQWIILKAFYFITYIYTTMQSPPLLPINFLFSLYLWVQWSYGTVSHRPTRTPSLTQAVTLPHSAYFPSFPPFISNSPNVPFSQLFVVITLWHL